MRCLDAEKKGSSNVAAAAAAGLLRHCFFNNSSTPSEYARKAHASARRTMGNLQKNVLGAKNIIGGFGRKII